MQIVFRMHGREYDQPSAVSLVRALAKDSPNYPLNNGTLREFLVWSFAELRDQVPLRELDLSDTLSDETLAFSYLCMLDEYQIGILSRVDGQTEGRDSCKELEG